MVPPCRPHAPALRVPYAYWAIGGVDADAYAAALEAGRLEQEVPANHSPGFAPVIQPTLDACTTALMTALAWLAAD